jgi:hypothetical protein
MNPYMNTQFQARSHLFQVTQLDDIIRFIDQNQPESVKIMAISMIKDLLENIDFSKDDNFNYIHFDELEKKYTKIIKKGAI